MKTKELLICETTSAEHQIVLKYLDNDIESFVYVDVHLVHMNFWDRIKYAIGYIFGHKSKFGAFDEIVLEPKHVESLKEVIAHLNKAEAKKMQLNLFDDTEGVNS